MTDQILALRNGAVATLVFNNPEKRNAMSQEMQAAAIDVLKDFEQDEAVRVIIVRGAGDKAFVSGGDISKFESSRSTPEQVAEYNARSQRFREAVRGVGKPTIAMIRGFCLGGGLALALNCDLRVTADDAQFGIPAARLGIGYGIDGLAKLVELVGPATAKLLLYTARRFPAAEALRMGLVHQVVPGAELEATVEALAKTIAGNAPLSIHSAKRVIDELAKDAEVRDAALCERVVAACFASQDYVEGRRAFMEKRRPVFTGK